MCKMKKWLTPFMIDDILLRKTCLAHTEIYDIYMNTNKSAGKNPKETSG